MEAAAAAGRPAGSGCCPAASAAVCRQGALIPPCLFTLWLPSIVQRGVPEGTPVVPVRDLPSRPRRNRKSETVRRAFSETYLDPGECDAAVLLGLVLCTAWGLGPRPAGAWLLGPHGLLRCCWMRPVIRCPICGCTSDLPTTDLPLPPSPPAPRSCSQLHHACVCARRREEHPHRLHAWRGPPGLAARPDRRGG